MKRFIVFANEKYSGVLSVLLDSLECFSNACVHVVCVNFKLPKEYPKFIVDEVTWPDEHASDVGTHRIDYLIKHRISNAILLDADCVANWNCDELLTVLDTPGNIRSLAPVAICGAFNPMEAEYFKTDQHFRYINSTPMVVFPKTLDWFSDVWRSWPDLNKVFNDLHAHSSIDDECAFNYLRAMAGERHHMSCCAPDRFMFNIYFDNPSAHLKEELYFGQHVTWQFFHGEKDTAVARGMFERMRDAGPDFLYRNPWRNKLPAVYCS